jgi:L-lactate dehydrogenase complex protein LldG
MSSREQILATLRANLKPFPAITPRPDEYLPVTVVSGDDLLARFTAELEERFGQVSVATDPDDAIQHVIALVGSDTRVIAWENLPLSGLVVALQNQNIEVVNVIARDANRITHLEDAETIRIGITGVDAAFATTGSMVLVSQRGQGRVPSLLPPVHIALLDRKRLFATPEDWFVREGREALKQSRSLALVTGPSSTGDIEQHSVLGAHGPRTVHVVVF